MYIRFKYCNLRSNKFCENEMIWEWHLKIWTNFVFIAHKKDQKKWQFAAMLEYEIVYKSNFPEVFFKNGVVKKFANINSKTTTLESIF